MGPAVESLLIVRCVAHLYCISFFEH